MLVHALPLAFVLFQAVPAPQAPAARPAPPPYNVSANATTAIDAAVKSASADDVRVLINWGANDDPGTAKFAAARSTKEFTSVTPSFFADEYKLVYVNVGHLDRNLDLAKKYGVKLKAGSLPAFTVLDASGKVIANTAADALRPSEDQSAIDSAKLISFLTDHKAPATDGEVVLSAAMKQAKAQNKNVFLVFSAPWCGWCHRMEDWMATPDIAPLFAKEFVTAKIDYDRSASAHEIEKRYIDKDQGLPWFAFLDASGKAIINSTTPAGANIGHPNQPEEVAHFQAMLEKAKKHLTDAEIDGMIKSLVAFNIVANGK